MRECPSREPRGDLALSLGGQGLLGFLQVDPVQLEPGRRRLRGVEPGGATRTSEPEPGDHVVTVEEVARLADGFDEVHTPPDEGLGGAVRGGLRAHARAGLRFRETHDAARLEHREARARLRGAHDRHAARRVPVDRRGGRGLVELGVVLDRREVVDRVVDGVVRLGHAPDDRDRGFDPGRWKRRSARASQLPLSASRCSGSSVVRRRALRRCQRLPAASSLMPRRSPTSRRGAPPGRSAGPASARPPAAPPRLPGSGRAPRSGRRAGSPR